MKSVRAAWAAAAAVVAAACGARAEAVRNGNDFALEWSSADAKARPALAAAHTNLLHTFRFMKVVSVAGPEEKGAMTLLTTEPASDISVVFVTDSRQSVELAKTLQPGDTVATRGRLTLLRGPKGDVFVVNPALLQFKDRSSPKAGKELLKEVDRTAR